MIATTFNQAQYDDFLAKSGDVYARTKYEVLLRWLRHRGPQRILNAGCGSGELSCLLAAAGHQVVGIDPDPTYIQLARDRAGDRFPDSTFVVSSIEDYRGPGGFDAAVSTDVLEHIEDDRTAFDRMTKLVRPGGFVLVTVPAGQWLFGYHDEQLGHYRRYNKRSVRQLVSDTCTVKKLRYFGGTLIPICLAYSKWLRRPYPVAKVGGGTSLVSRVLNGLLAAERRVPLPIGTSVLLWRRAEGRERSGRARAPCRNRTESGMNYFVTGGAGFIGSNLVDRLLAAGHHVTAYDNFSTGQRAFLEGAGRNPRFALVEGDLLDLPALKRAVGGHDFVFHLAANADVRFGTNHPDRDLQQNTIATFNVLEAMRVNGVTRIGFSSTGSVYGEAEVLPTPENAPFPVQTSLYAASKVAGEALISAYAHGFGFTVYIFRFVSILGERYTHGHVFDFYAKLRANPHTIEVLGDGKQRKSYLYVQDCIDAILTVVEKATEQVNVVNLGADEYCQVDNSLGWICDRLGLNPKVKHTGGKRGWIGDSPFIFLDTAKLKSFGWRQKLSIRDAVIRTLDYLRANPWVLESRQAA